MAKITGGAVLLGAATSGVAALTLYERVIPRQDKIRVNLEEMADMKKWEEYKKIIHPNKEWIMSQNLEHVTIKSRDTTSKRTNAKKPPELNVLTVLL